MGTSSEVSTTLLILCCFQLIAGSCSTTITIVNNCNHAVGTTISSEPGNFTLQLGESTAFEVPPIWSGRVLGYSNEKCPEETVPLSATAAEFSLNGGSGGVDTYDVSVVDGFSISMSVQPRGGITTGNCIATGCFADVNTVCAFDALKVMSEDGKVIIGCKSACQAFGDSQFCCTGPYATPQTCKPNPYSLFFKAACPHARTYVYDESSTWIFSCISANYVITFCPPITSLITPINEKNPAKSGAFLDGLAILKGVGIVLGVGISLIYPACKIITCFKSRKDESRRENRVPQVGLTLQPSLSINV